MNELSRMRYLDALGIDSYVSRRQLPGAAVTQRLALVRSTPQTAQSLAPTAESRPQPQSQPQASPPAMPEMPGLDDARASKAPSVEVVPARPREKSEAVSFSLAAIFVGQIAWIEELDNRPLAREQVQLVQAMARALHDDIGRPEVTQFDWPTHRNHQLDLGAEAAQAGVAGFLQRQLEQRKCRGLVLLGKNCEARVPLGQLGGITSIVTDSTVAMLQEPARKRQVWRDLKPLVLRV